jgi:2,3-dihydroxybenzoate decarboxylase
MGAAHVLFGTDYPSEDIETAARFLRDAPISDADRLRIGHRNAERLLRLAPTATPAPAYAGV